MFETNRVEILCSVLVSNTLLILIRKLSRGAGGRVQSELGLYARTAKRGEECDSAWEKTRVSYVVYTGTKL